MHRVQYLHFENGNEPWKLKSIQIFQENIYKTKSDPSEESDFVTSCILPHIIVIADWQSMVENMLLVHNRNGTRFTNIQDVGKIFFNILEANSSPQNN